jgi:hypothetical protein
MSITQWEWWASGVMAVGIVQGLPWVCPCGALLVQVLALARPITTEQKRG